MRSLGGHTVPDGAVGILPTVMMENESNKPDKKMIPSACRIV